MSATTILAIAIPVIVLAAAALLFASLRRRDTDQATGRLSRETRRRDTGAVALGADAPAATPVTGREVERQANLARTGGAVERVQPATPAPFTPPDPEVIGVSRRQFFNRSAIGLMSFGLAGFGASVVAFLWPQLSGGFGSKISIGNVSDVIASIRENSGFLYVPEGRAWVTEFPVDAVPKAEPVYPEPVLAGMRQGISALYQKCPHLGCRVPECATSQWFECPCHGSQYNQNGEKKGGPAPRGMDRFAVAVNGGTVVIDTGQIFGGPPIGTNTTGQEAEGPHCIGAGGGH